MASSAAARAIADGITLRKLYAGDRLPVDVDLVAGKDGKRIFRFDLGPRVREIFVGDTILINSGEADPAAVRWLKAHALGHVGHAGQPANERALPGLQSVYVRREEALADLFARHLLIPAEEWTEAQRTGGLEQLRDLVGVPAAQIEAYCRDVSTGLFVPDQWIPGERRMSEDELPAGWHLLGVNVRGPLDDGDAFRWAQLPTVPRPVKAALDQQLMDGREIATVAVEERWYRFVDGAVYVAVPK